MPERSDLNYFGCTSVKECILKNECPPGKYGDYDHENCQSCPAGRYLNESGKVASTPVEACKECELGKIAEKEGQVGCDIVFLFVSEVRELFGKDDPKVITNSADCLAAYSTLHPYGKATSAVSGSGKPTGCSTDWNAGNLYIESDTQESNWCGKDNHRVSHDEINSCILKNECPPGKYGDYDHVKCQACPLGRYTAENGEIRDGTSPACTQCTLGKFTESTGQPECQDCPVGKHQTSHSDTPPCKDCSSGQYSDVASWAQSCKDCAAGTYAKAAGMASCESCPGGWYKGQTGATSCTECEGGKYATAESISCKQCLTGVYSKAGADSCSDCEPGKYNSGREKESCTDCDMGRSNPDPGRSEKCTVCAVGKFAAQMKQLVCENCRVGYYDSKTTVSSSRRSCEACASGQYLDKAGQTSCKPCPLAGQTTFHDATGSTSVSACVFPRQHYSFLDADRKCDIPITTKEECATAKDALKLEVDSSWVEAVNMGF